MGIVPRNGVIVVGIMPAEACTGFVFMWDDVVEEWNGKTNCETKPTIPVQKHSISCGQQGFMHKRETWPRASRIAVVATACGADHGRSESSLVCHVLVEYRMPIQASMLMCGSGVLSFAQSNL